MPEKDIHRNSESTGRADQKDELERQREAVARRMARIRHKLVVLSGKGGVGKSTVAVNLAVAAARDGLKVGLLDVDVHGPSVPLLLGLQDARAEVAGGGLRPVSGPHGLEVMSIGFLLEKADDAVIWRGPMKFGVIRQFLADVEWGDLDLLVVDSPPGTGDEPLAVVQLVGNADGAVVVTTPQGVAIADVRRCVGFCRRLGLPVSGVIENMSGFVCPHCGAATDVFGSGGGEAMAEELGVPFLGRIPIDPQIVASGEAGRPLVLADRGAPAGALFVDIVRRIVAEPRRSAMRFAVPLTGGVLSDHFGHCEEFAFVEAEPETGDVREAARAQPPRHEPGALPSWLSENGVDVVIAGGMGRRAQGLFAESGIEVIVGVPAAAPEELVKAHLAGTLQAGQNICDH